MLPQRSEDAQASGLRRRAGRKAATSGDHGEPVNSPPTPAHQQHSPSHSPVPPSQPSPPDLHPWPQSLIHNPLTQLHAPAWFCGLAFALHPVHTEAVAGVVGHAELLCALLSVPALWGYLAAAEWAAQRRAAGRWTAAAAAVHWVGVAGAVALALLAALSKEIGITVLGAMIAGDVLLVPIVVEEQVGEGQVTDGNSTKATDGSVAAATEGGPDGAEDAGRRGLGRAAGGRARVSRLGRLVGWVLWREPKWLRLLLLAAAGVAYVRLRSWVAVDQLVRIYRKVREGAGSCGRLQGKHRTTPFWATAADCQRLGLPYLAAAAAAKLLPRIPRLTVDSDRALENVHSHLAKMYLSCPVPFPRTRRWRTPSPSPPPSLSAPSPPATCTPATLGCCCGRTPCPPIGPSTAYPCCPAQPTRATA